jgi:hypothetical protein
MGQTKELYIDKIIEIILGLILMFKGEIVFGATLLTFGLITIKVTLS